MIVAVTDENVRAWAELCNQLWPDSCIEEFIESFRNHRENAFMYVQDNQYAAFINLSLRRDYVEGTESRPVGYIEGIYVCPEYRGKGISRLLAEHAEKWSIANGCKELASDCELTNTGSIEFHKKVGFAEANRIVCFVKKLM